MSVTKKLMIIIFVVCFLSGFIIVAMNHRPRLRLGDNYINCNPGAKVNPKRIYQLNLWDTNWPVLETDGYKAYLKRMIRDFQKIYPNIQVRITLVDLNNGPNLLADALKNNSAPDVYCSAFNIPKFDPGRQIPVGFYLKPQDKEAYFPETLKLVRRYGVECFFPRWLAPTIWVGNQKLLSGLGLPIGRVEQGEYSWVELLASAKNLPRSQYILAGNLGHNGLFTDIARNLSTTTNLDGHFLTENGVITSLDYLNQLIVKNRIPADMESNMIGHFLSGDTLMLAGVRPVIYRFLKLKLAKVQEATRFEPVLISPPLVGQKPVLLTESGVIGIYRNKFTVGDDQITAAVKLGQFISTYEASEPFQEMMLIPAAKQSAERWCRELKPVIGDVSSLIEQVKNRSILNLPEYVTYQREIYPVLQEFFSRKAPLANVQERLVRIKW